jgi:glutathione synthase/RimK-type ligase-like ATP-grasp enzyme
MIAINYQPGNNFSVRWKEYCEKNNIPFKIVSCYDSDILEQLNGCKAILWHVNNFDYRDQVFAKYLIKAIECKGVKVFPNNNTVWHFDDKVAQKYLLEAIEVPFVNTHVFYDKKVASNWASTTDYPKVFKLRKGSGSKNVRLVHNKSQALSLINKAFGSGFVPVSMWFLLQERYRKFRLGKDTFTGLLKGIIRLFIGTPYSRMTNNEKGYIYFQDFIPKNDFDIRVIVIGDKAFGIKRMVRKNDFRASGSGHIIYDQAQIDLRCVKMAFETNKKLDAQCLAYDFVYNQDNQPLIIEISFGFNQIGYLDCPGYWDENLNWFETKFLPQDWMLQDIIAKDGITR